MTRVSAYIEKIDFEDRSFVGTLTFRNEELTLPDGSKIALGIDDGRWILVYQTGAGASFKVFEYDSHEKKIVVDKKPGTGDDIKQFKKLISYFFVSANIEDLVTLLPPQVMEK